jgi:hypothetical protein
MKILLLALAFTTLVYAQNEINKFQYDEDPMLYFPHNEGDVWEYYDVDEFIIDTVRATLQRDSIDTTGNVYVSINYFAIRLGIPIYTDYYKIDTLYNVWRGLIGYNFLLYRLDATLGDQWVALAYGDSGYQSFDIMRVKVEEEGSIFGVPTNFKTYLNFYAEDSTDTIGILTNSAYTLARGFGMVFYSTGFTTYHLRGCIINGIKYGTVTSLKDFSENNPNEFKLQQNYPNPFNPNTTISFNVPTRENISLIVYDIMGKEVIKLIENKSHSPGEYREIWNGKNSYNEYVSSGIYFYRLLSGEKVITRSMILMK